MFINENTVKLRKVILSWDGVGKEPEVKDDGSINYNVSFLISKTHEDFADAKKLLKKQLDTGRFKGVLPSGANSGLVDADVSKLGQIAANHQIGNASTKDRPPLIFDENGNEITLADAKAIFYPGIELMLLVHCFDYDNKNKGCKFGLDGIRIVNRNAPQLDVASGMARSQVADALGCVSVSGSLNDDIEPPPTDDIEPPPADDIEPPPADDLASGKIMTSKAKAPYETYIAKGWTDEKLVAHGLLIQ